MKRYLFALALGLTVFGGITAFAASLGGVTTNSFGAGTAVIASCDSDGITANVNVGQGGGRPEWLAVSLTLKEVDQACDGKRVTVQITDGPATLGITGFVIGTINASQASSSTGQSFQFLHGAFPAEHAETLAVLIQ